MSRGGLVSVTLFLAGGCAEPTFAECEDASCRAKTIKAAFDADPDGVLAWLGSDGNALEQAALTDLLVHEYPQQAKSICGVVPSGSLAEARCRKVDVRPHLYKFGERESVPVERTASGPKTGFLPELTLSAPWPTPDADEVAGECAHDDLTCLSDRARERAGTGALVEAGQLCQLAWPAGSSARDECTFEVAERAASAKGPSMAADAVAACMQAGAFRRQCLQHVLVIAQPVPPPADRVDVASVEAIKAHVEEVRKLGSSEADVLAGYSWAVWTRDAYRQAKAVNGTLLAALPPEAAPHVRAAAALRLGELYLATFTDMDQAAAKLKAHLDIAPAPLAEPAANELTAIDRLSGTAMTQYWMADANVAEGAVEAVWCMGAGRRTVGQNEVDDLRIAVLEAAARLETRPPSTFFLSVIGSKQVERVRWTAARLGAELHPEEARPLRELDPSRLVRVALSGQRAGAGGAIKR